MTDHTLNPHVIAYAQKGWAVFPVHTWANGCCTCGKAACDRPAKHPWCEQGFYAATTDCKLIQAWATAKPGCNWGIRTGEASGLLVLDIDPDKGGDESLARLQQQYGDLPPTLTVRTGSGGRHLYFKYPHGSGLSVGTGILPGIDFRGEGGYVIAPPSLHASGDRYEWLSPSDTPVAVAPPRLVELLGKGKAKPQPSPRTGTRMTVEADKPDLLTSEGVGEGRRNAMLCELAGRHLARGDSLATVEAAALAWAGRCTPPLEAAEVERTVRSLWDKHRRANKVVAEDPLFVCSLCSQPDGSPPPSPVVSPEPLPTLHPDAYHGLAGDFVRLLAPHTEADEAGLLVTLLTCFGNCVGRSPHFLADGTPHHANLFAVLVGNSAKARKGTSKSRILGLFDDADPWKARCIASGLSSGEGLIWAVRDATERMEAVKERSKVVGYQRVIADQGVEDKRLLVIESEFSKVLRTKGREGNVLGELIRQAWETGTLSTLTKNSPCQATDAHISILGHITQAELAETLTHTSCFNGEFNRFLWCCVRRSKLLPDGGGDFDASPLQRRLADTIDRAKPIGRMQRSDDASRLWHELYCSEFAREEEGIVGGVIARADAQTLRLSMLYALLDGSEVIEAVHLRAALAVWRYCEASARMVFGHGASNATTIQGEALKAEETLPVRLLNAVSTQPGINRRGLYESLGGRVKSEELDMALAYLHGEGLAHPVESRTGGRPGECWYPCPQPGDDTASKQTKSSPVSEADDEPASKQTKSVAESEPSEGTASKQTMCPPEPVPPPRQDFVRSLATHVTITEIPAEPLAPLTFFDLFQAWQGGSVRLTWEDGRVVCCSSPPPSPGIVQAVATFQAELQPLLSKPQERGLL
jgi:hypothetical protein